MSADILVHDQTGKLIVAVEVRAYRETPPEFAVEILPDLLIHNDAPFYLILVTHDHTFFWKDPAHDPAPVHTIPTDRLLESYLLRLHKSAADVPYSVLGMLVFDWIADATRARAEVPELLDAIGFTDAIRGARVAFQTAA